MKIIKDAKFSLELINILRFIAKDKKSAALKFEKELEIKIQGVVNFPLKHRKSYYFNDESYRDLIYQGYIIIYKIQNDAILMLEIFKWQDR